MEPGRVTEASPAPGGGQARPEWGLADVLTGLRLPLAALFVFVPGTGWRLAILAAAAASDLLDGWIARRLGASRLGPLLDPVADKLFMLCAFGVVAFSGVLSLWELAGVLARDLAAAVAFVVVGLSGKPASLPARLGGKAVTVGQVLVLAAFLAGSPLVHPLAWMTTGVGLYAIWDYSVHSRAERVRYD